MWENLGFLVRIWWIWARTGFEEEQKGEINKFKENM